MARRSTSRVGSIATRLAILIVLPLAATSHLGVQTIKRETDDAIAAREIAQDAGLRQAVASVISPAQLEQIALEGLARVDELGVPRDLVVEFSGVNFESTYADNVIDFDRVLDELVVSYGDRTLRDGTTLSTSISFFRGALKTQRSLSEQRRASRDDIREVFESLDEMLNETLATTATSGTGSISIVAATRRDRLGALRFVQLTAGARGRALLDGLTSTDAESSSEIGNASAQLESAIASYVAQLRPDEAATFESVREDLRPIPPELLDLAAASTTTPDAVTVEIAATAFLDQLAFLDRLEAYSADVHATIARNLENQAVDAESLAARTRIIIIGLIGLTLLLAVLIAGSTLGPLRRLRRRATQVANGRLDVKPLAVRGPSDIRTLTVSVNSMLATLQAVDDQVRSLADGRPADATAANLPGDIGISLRQSLERLESVTTQLHTSEQLASAIVEQAVDGIWTVDARGRIASANAASESILGVPAADQLGKPISTFLTTLDGTIAIDHGGESASRYLVASSGIDGGAEPLTAVIARNVSEHLRFEEQLAYQANHDALTGLPNRYALLDHINNLGGRRVAVLFVDLDGFKTVNDVQGHQAGDAVLEQIAQRLAACIRPTDFVGRIGGDEFVVTMGEFDDIDHVFSFGYRLIREIELPYATDAQAFTISASVGVSVYEEGIATVGLSALDAIQQADSAVYLAKRRGRGRVEIFDTELQSAMLREADLEMALRSAVSSGELELHLQPIMDLATGEFTSAEALVRWHRPGAGMVPPSDFIYVAERSGLIAEIERWVLEAACTTLARWRRLDPQCTTRIAVNVSGHHLLEGNFLADLRYALRSTNADPHLLGIELTETQLLDDVERAITILDTVRALGVTVAIDDFGTGYSSMAYLHQLPIDTLKIDRQFVAAISDDRFDSGLLDALLTIAAALNVSVVAEGIENTDQLEHLRRLNCDHGQGFLLARPVQISEAEAIMGIGLTTRPQFDIATMKMLSRTVSAL